MRFKNPNFESINKLVMSVKVMPQFKFYYSRQYWSFT